MGPPRMAASGGGCYDPRPAADPWCSGPTCQPVTLEIAGSNPVGSARSAFPQISLGRHWGVGARLDPEPPAATFTARAVAFWEAASFSSRSRYLARMAA